MHVQRAMLQKCKQKKKGINIETKIGELKVLYIYPKNRKQQFEEYKLVPICKQNLEQIPKI